MSAELFFLIAFVACVAYWYSRREKSGGRSSAPQAVEPVPPSPIYTSEEPDQFLQQVAAEKMSTDAAITIARQQYERELETRFADDVKIKERLSKFARVNELDKALIALWSEVQHYPAWSTRDDFDKWNKLHLTSITGSNEGEMSTVEFTHGSQRFKVAERKWYGMEGESYSDFALSEDGEEVFAIGCSVDHGEYETSYRCHGISAFKKRGNWAKALLEYSGQIQIARNKSSADLKYFRADEIKTRFEE